MAREISVEDLGDPRLEAYTRLTEHQLRHALEVGRGIFVAESPLVVEVALDAGMRPLSFLVARRHLEAARRLLGRSDAPAFVVDDGQMEQLTGYRFARGLLACMERPRERTVDEVLKGAGQVAVVEDLVDVSNVGALFRNAAALGADAVVLSPRCADPLCRRALRASMGCALRLPWARAAEDAWPHATFDTLHANGLEVVALALTDDAVPVDDASLVPGEPRALVFGCEGTGLAPATLAATDRTAIIPMTAGIDSLNVAASSAVAFWQLFRRR